MRVYSPGRRKSIYRNKPQGHKFIIKIILLLIFVILIFLGISRTPAPPEDTILKYKRILEKDPANIEAYISLGEDCYQKALEAELKKNEKETNTLLEDTVKYYQNALKLDEGGKISPQSRYHLGIAYFKLSKYSSNKDYYAQAEDELKKSLEEKFETAETHIYLGHIYFKKGLFDDAIDEYMRAKALNPNDVAAWYNLGWVYKVKGMPSNAIVAFRNAVMIPNLDKDINIRILAVLGEIYYEQGLIEHAKDEYKTILKLDRASEIAHYQLGKIYKKQGDLELAARELKSALKLNPKNKDAKAELDDLEKKIKRF
ncbi:MAG: tetratricopeptide repeat protein [bacterium]|nr:tetratricopeptide repeat protein [bacterium]